MVNLESPLKANSTASSRAHGEWHGVGVLTALHRFSRRSPGRCCVGDKEYVVFHLFDSLLIVLPITSVVPMPQG